MNLWKCVYKEVVFTSTAVAKYYSGGYDLYQISYDVVDRGIESHVNTAARDWSTSVGTRFIQSTSSANKFRQSSPSYSWYGLYTPKWGSGGVSSFEVQINAVKLLNDYSSQNAVISTFSHEIGHALFLDDLRSGYGNRSIMSYERTRNTIYKPQSMDISEVKSFMN